MPLIDDDIDLTTVQGRLHVFMNENRNKGELLNSDTSNDSPSFGKTWGASVRSMNTIGSFVTNRLSKMMAGYSPFYRDPYSFEGGDGFDPYERMLEDEFINKHPYAIQGSDMLMASRSAEEFDLTLGILKQNWDDMVTLSESGVASNLTAGAVANVVDPINLIPLSWIGKTKKGVGTYNLLKNIHRAGTIAAAGNLAQEEILHHLQPGRPQDRLTSNLIAVGAGYAFGGSIGFLTSPNWRMSTKAIGKIQDSNRFIPFGKIENARKKVTKLFETPLEDGRLPRNVTEVLQDGEKQLDELLAGDPVEGANVTILHRMANDEASIPADANGAKLRQLQKKYDKAGVELTVGHHPLQDDYDVFGSAERTLNDAHQALSKIVGKEGDAGIAGAKELAEGNADWVAQYGVGLISKLFNRAPRYLMNETPSSAFDSSILDVVRATRRVFFHDGSVSRGSVANGDYVGVQSAEALKEIYEAELYATLRELRESYFPHKEYNAILGRSKDDGIEVQTGKKIAAFLDRKSITYTDAHGQTHTINAYNGYGDFMRHAVKILREEKAHHDGFIDSAPADIPEPLRRSTDAIRRYYDKMLDLGDQAGLLPGKRSLAEAESGLREIEEQLSSLVEKQKIVHAVDKGGVIYNSTEDFVEGPRTLEEWDTLFGESKLVDTPIGEVKIGAGQFAKLQSKGRIKFSGLVKPTLERPALIIRDADDGLLFIKPFEKDGVKYFMSVGYKIEGQKIIVSSYPVKPAKIKRALKSGDLLFGSTTMRTPTAKSPLKQITKGQGSGPEDSLNIVGKDGAEINNVSSAGKRYTQIPQKYDGAVLQDWGAGGVRTAKGNVAVKPEWLQQLTRVSIKENPTLLRHIRETTGEVWEVQGRKGKHWRTDHYLVPQKTLQEAKAKMKSVSGDTLEKRIASVEAKLAKAQDRVAHVQEFIDNSHYYFTRRFLAGRIRNNKSGFVSWLKRSWHKSRRFGVDPASGNRVVLDPDERPIVDALRRRMNITEDIRTEGDLKAMDMKLAEQYERAVDDYFQEVAESTWAKITDADHGHGVEHAYAGGSPLMKRQLTVDESDAAAMEFLDNDPERILNSYHHTVGGKIATHTALKRAKKYLGLGDDVKSPQDLITHIDKQFQALQEITSRLDSDTGTGLTPSVQRDRSRVIKHLERRIGNLEGQGLKDSNPGELAFGNWLGRQVLNMNYLALLGGQTLTAMNDVASLTLFAEITSIPRNVKYMIKAMAPLKNASKRDLTLMRMAFESEHSRILSIGDIDYDDHTFATGFGADRTVTGAIGAGLNRASTVFNEASMVNSWNRYIKRVAAHISMDRILTNSKRLIKAEKYIADGMERGAAIRKAGLSRFDYGRLKEFGINLETANRMIEMLRKYGTDEDGNAFSHMTTEEFMNFKGVALPNADSWLKVEGDNARQLYDLYVSTINTEVEKAMVITPGLTDRPLINDRWWGRAVNQFQTFAMAWQNQVLRPLAQRPAGKQLSAITAYFVTGTFVDATRNHLSGRRSIDETIQLWQERPLEMTYSVVNTSGLTGWFNRPMAFFDKMGMGPANLIGADTTKIGRSAFQAQSALGALSPTADAFEKAVRGVSGVWADPSDVHGWHTLRKLAPFQNLIWFRASNRFLGFDPFVTEQIREDQRRRQYEPRP